MHLNHLNKLRSVFTNLLLLFILSAGSGSAQAQPSDRVWSNPEDITSGVSTNLRSFGTILCDPYQNVHIFWADQSDDGAAVFYRNNTQSAWSFPTDVLAVEDPDIYYLRAAISPRSDTVHLTWVNLTFNGDMYYSNAPLSGADKATAWLQPQVIASGVSNSDIAVDPQGNIHIVYSASDSVGINNEVYHIVSSDDGLIWSEPELVFSRTYSVPSFIQVWIDIDGKGRLHLGVTQRSQEYGVASEIGYIHTLSDGKTWGEYTMIQNQSTTFQGLAWIEPYAFGDDEVHLTWHDPRRMHIWSRDGGNTWSEPEEIMPLGGAFGGPNELTKDSAGTLYVVLAISNGVYSLEWKDQRWRPPEQIDSRFIDPHGQHIVACGGNQLHVIYYDRTGDRTIWYSTKKVNAPAIEQEPISQPTAIRDTRGTSTATALPDSQPAPTIDWMRETLAWENQNSSQTSPGPTLSNLIMFVVPSTILVIGVLVVASLRLRR